MPARFPGGSIASARNKRAMEIIRSHVRGGIRFTYQAGAGIVADSDPEKEYDETLHKAAGIRLAVQNVVQDFSQ